MIETEKKQERILLVGVELQGMDNFDMSMEELASLAKTAGGDVGAPIHKSGRNTTPRPLSAQENSKKSLKWSKQMRSRR